MAGESRILAVGDCNTKGAGEYRYNGYPEVLSRRLSLGVDNCGYTMSTTREGLNLLADNLTDRHSHVIIQYGLVDSYTTFKHSPYVLYYPDSFVRKQLRSLVKKYKKSCRKLGLNRKLGEKPVVDPDEYCRNLRSMLQRCGERRIMLLETIPHHDQWRNGAIQQYNSLLASLADEHPNCTLVRTYEAFAAAMDRYYSDRTHANMAGFEFMADRIIAAMESW